MDWAGVITEHVRVLREGDDAAKTTAAQALGINARRGHIAHSANQVLIAEAGGIPLLVDLLRDGSVRAKEWAARALGQLVWTNDNRVLIAEAGGIPPLVDLLRAGRAEAKYWAAWTLGALWDNDAYAVAITMTIGFDAVVELARNGNMHVHGYDFVHFQPSSAQRATARLLLRKCLPRAIPDEIVTAAAAFLVKARSQ